MNMIKQKSTNKNYLNLGIAILCCTLIFLAIELKYPYFFLRDDNADSYLAEYMYGINCIAEGKFPLFCFNEFGGQRFFAEGQVGIFNPLVYFSAELSLLLLGKPDLMMDILAYLSIILGCTGSFLLLRHLGCTDVPAIIGSIAWNFNCYNIWEGSSWMIVVYTTSVFPFFLLSSILLFEKCSIHNIILAAIPRIYMFYLGHPQFFIFASIFDCIYIGVYCLLKTERGRKIQTLFRLIRDYVLVYISTAVLSLPLLIPEYQYTLLTYSNGSARTYENILIEMFLAKPAFFIPFLYTEANYSFFYPPYIGYLLEAFGLAGVFFLIFAFKNKKLAKYIALGNVMLASLPCLLIAYLLLFSRDALKVIWYIPILNRFQYYHRISIFFAAFAVIFCSISMTALSDILKNRLNLTMNVTPIIAGSVILIESMTFGFLYTATPHQGRGPLYDTSELYNYDFASRFYEGGRYICIGYTLNPYNVNRDLNNLSENLNYNLAKLYQINNISGYAGVLNYSYIINYGSCFDHMNAITGSLFECYPNMIEDMRSHSVSWYIVSPDMKDKCAPIFSFYGIELVAETDHSLVFYDPNYEPYAFDVNGNEIKCLQDVNSLHLSTFSDFPGGIITLNYAYDPNLVCYLDGEPIPIFNDPMNWQFKFECPPGEHSIVIQYEDRTLVICCIITAEYIVFACLSILVYKQIKRRKQNEE